MEKNVKSSPGSLKYECKHWAQGHHGRFLAGKTATVVPHHRHVVAAASMIYFAKSRQDQRLGGLASCGSPAANVRLFM